MFGFSVLNSDGEFFFYLESEEKRKDIEIITFRQLALFFIILKFFTDRKSKCKCKLHTAAAAKQTAKCKFKLLAAAAGFWLLLNFIAKANSPQLIKSY
jgi:hypothetical protein